MEKYEEKVRFELTSRGDKACILIQGQGEQIVKLLTSVLLQDKNARELITIAFAQFVTKALPFETPSLIDLLNKAEKRHVNKSHRR